MYGSDAGQSTRSLYTKGLPPLCDKSTMYMYSTRQKKLAIPSLRKTVYMVRCYKRTVEQRCANAQRRCAQRQAVPFKRSRAKIDNARV